MIATKYTGGIIMSKREIDYPLMRRELLHEQSMICYYLNMIDDLIGGNLKKPMGVPTPNLKECVDEIRSIVLSLEPKVLYKNDDFYSLELYSLFDDHADVGIRNDEKGFISWKTICFKHCWDDREDRWVEKDVVKDFIREDILDWVHQIKYGALQEDIAICDLDTIVDKIVDHFYY